MGIEVVERPVAAQGEFYARHDPDRLTRAVMELYWERAVRIFRGESRYILEE